MSHSSQPYSTVIIAGSGYTGKRLANVVRIQAENVVAVTNSSKIQLRGVNSLQINLDLDPSTQLHVGENALIYYLIPPPSQGVKDTRTSQIY